MNTNKNSKGLHFILKLDMSADDKKKLVQLAKEAIDDDTHDKRTFLERKNQDLRVNPYSIDIGNAIATGHAMANNDFSTKDKLYMIMKRYISLMLQRNPKASKDKALERFCHDFATAFPEEYGSKRPPKNFNTMQMQFLKRNREMMQ